MSRRQATLETPFELAGVGVHTGVDCRLRLRPAAVDEGFRLIHDGQSFPAHVDQVSECTRSTKVGPGPHAVSTVEHLLAAAAAHQLDNLLIEVEGGEVPILDGSALPFFEEFAQAGRVEQGKPVEPLVLERPVWVGQGDSLVVARPHHRLELEYLIYYAHPMLGCQQITFIPGQDSFLEELAPARTFALWEEVQPLFESGLAKGGDLSNALVIYQDRYSSPLRLVNEPVRHKCLDLLGDLALLGRPLQARVTAVCAGHRLHVALARKILQESEHA
ncbi:MAG: UDP-3-O-[3-hydroxymyristoyl] N-acetylglucosamine deacetylase [Candidatus Eremiobacteraeota bacterium]|nr:UDP-3-O-[3-hydroxymyristoyl] N-acetylglucosamine deacetylase [Candidatus Eremiobacteraeota bacterium]